MSYCYADEQLARTNLMLSSSYHGIIHASTVWKGELITVLYNIYSKEIEDIWYPHFLDEDDVVFLGSLMCFEGEDFI